jgi:hypothetical protein
MCTSGRILVVGSYVPFRYGFGGRQLCSFHVGVWWEGVMYPSGSGSVVGSYVPLWLGMVYVVMCLSGRGLVVGIYVRFKETVGGRQLCALLLGGWW